MQHRIFWLWTLLAALAGCRPDEQVAHYRVTKIKQPIAAPTQSPAAKTDGMLAAIVPHGSQAWFFKLTGSAGAVARQGEAFRKFVKSVHFIDDEPRYEPAESWQAKGPSGMRYETFEIPSVGAPLELAISTLPKSEGGDAPFLLSNINRWRGQLGLAPLGPSQLGESSSAMQLADGSTATLVDLVGAPEANGMTPPAAAQRPAVEDDPALAGPVEGGPIQRAPVQGRPAESVASGEKTDGMLGAIVPHGDQAWFFKLTGPAPATDAQTGPFRKFIESVRFVDGEPRYQTPVEWQPQGPSGMRFETFRIPSAGKPLELAVTTLVKPPGDDRGYVLANVNRWRNQIGLTPIDDAQLAAGSTQVGLADNVSATLVNLVGKLQSGGMTPPFATGK